MSMEASTDNEISIESSEDNNMIDGDQEVQEMTEFERSQIQTARTGKPSIYAWMALSIVLLSRVSHQM